MEQELQRVRFTRRAEEATAASEVAGVGRPSGKRGAVLGELTNVLRNDAVAPASKAGSKKRKKPTALDLNSTKKKKKNSDEEMEVDYYQYLHQMERRPVPDYIATVQDDVTANMRGVLVDWLVEVAEEYKLGSDTLFLSISYIDRFLSRKAVARQRLQLLGVSSMLIASKYEEISPPHVKDFCYITDNTYTKEQIVKMEADVLKSLNFEMGNPTTKTFLGRFISVAQEGFKASAASQLEYLCGYLAEMSLLDYSCVKFLPSLVASSIVFLASFIIRPNKHPWGSTLEDYVMYKPADMKECVLLIHDMYLGKRGGSLHTIREKYKNPKFRCVMNLPSQDIPASYFEDID